MAATQKAVFNARPDQIRKMQAVVRSGRYRSVSELVRSALDEKLQSLQQERLQRQVASYVAAGCADEEDDLVGLQPIEEDVR